MMMLFGMVTFSSVSFVNVFAALDQSCLVSGRNTHHVPTGVVFNDSLKYILEYESKFNL